MACGKPSNPSAADATAQHGTGRGRREMAKVWEAIFLLVEPPRAGERYGVMLLNSNARSHVALTNAIGVVTPPQLRALTLVLQTHPRHAWIILPHHHVMEHPGEAIGLRKRIGLALVNDPDVLAALGADGADKYRGSFHVHDLAVGAGGGVRLTRTERVRVG